MKSGFTNLILDFIFVEMITSTMSSGCEFMTNCPKCGKEVDPTKNYKVTIGPAKTDQSKEITFGMCQDCALIVILGLRKSQ